MAPDLEDLSRMILKRLIAAVTAVTLSLAGCATVETPPRDAVPGPALWALSDEDTTIYLFGTVHALPRDREWFDARIARAFAEADKLVTEVDLTDVTGASQAMQVAGTLPEGQNLRQMMSGEDREKFEAAMVSLGLPVQALDRMQPWLAAMTLAMLPLIQRGYDPQSGVEIALGSRAEGKQRAALESVDEQIALFAGLPHEAQLAFLGQTVEQVPRSANGIDAMVAEWIKGDAEALARLLNAELTDPVLYERLLTQRNARWAEWIEQRMDQPGTVFVAVGAGHLAGRGSVQDHLKARGLKVRRIWR
jgi:uncharacterized protein